MSNEDNTKPSEDTVQNEPLSSPENTAEKSETNAQNQENITSEAKQAGENAQKMVGKLTASLLAFSKEKPKVFYGALVGVVILFAIMIFSGGDSSPSVSGPAIKNLVIGQRYVLQSPNTTDKLATIRLVAVPGTIAAYDDTEEDDRTGGCKHMKQGTPVSVLGFQDAYGKQNAFVNVQIEQEGPCKGSSAWTLAINVQ